MPVSVKTRIGFRKVSTEEWVKTLLQAHISVLTVHLRTASEMSKPPAHWEEIDKVVKLRNKIAPKTLIFGNGDIKSIQEAKEKCKKYGIDGVMIGRGIFENVYLFKKNVDPTKVTPKDKMKLLSKHVKLFNKTYPNSKNFEVMKKFVKCYINNFNGAVEIREKLMQTKNIKELESFISLLCSL